MGYKINRSILLLACYGATGMAEKARPFVEPHRKVMPNFQIRLFVEKNFPFKEPADIDRLLADLAKAGVE